MQPYRQSLQYANAYILKLTPPYISNTYITKEKFKL